MSNSPTQLNARITELDVFRGFAIFGIFMVNILVMNVCFAYRFEWEAEQTGWIQQASLFVLEHVFYSKFFTIFSFLFGIGVALQMQRMKETNRLRISFFLRRFSSLFLFGLAHITLLWAGDILHLYGMLGLLLLLLFKLPPKGLLIATLVVFFFPLFSELVEAFYRFIEVDYSQPLAAMSREEIRELKHHGSYTSGIVLRLKEYLFASGLIYGGIGPIALTMMLFGGYVVKKGWLFDLKSTLQKVKWPLFIGACILLIYRFTLLYAVLPNFELVHGSALSIILATFFQLSEIAISMLMLWLIGYLLQKRSFSRILSPLRHVGRMAFTNYIFQSVLGYLIMRTFNGYEQFSVFGCILIVIAIYLTQIVLSKLWFIKFKFGPLEWLWRCISYWKIVRIRKDSFKTIV